MQFEPLTDYFGVMVTGADLRALSSKDVTALYGRFVDAGVMCVRGQALEPSEFLAFARKLGTPIRQIYGQFNRADYPEIGMLTSEDTDSAGSGRRQIRGTSWHTDASYFEHPPKATMLFAEVIPPDGGDTQFVSTAAAYDALPSDTQSYINSLHARHMYQSTRSPRTLIKRTAEQEGRFPEGIAHPLARVNADTGRRAIYLNPIRIETVDGLPREQSDELLDQLLEHCLQPQFQYRHRWQAGDVVIWDNRSVLHQANDDYDWRSHKRRLMRVMLEGERPR